MRRAQSSLSSREWRNTWIRSEQVQRRRSRAKGSKRWNLTFCAKRQRREWRREVGSPAISPPSSARKTRRYLYAKNSWRWPVFAVHCRLQRWRVKRADGMRHGRRRYWLPTWTPSRRRKILRPGLPFVKRNKEGRGKTGRSKHKGDGRTMNGFNRKTGQRNWCYTQNSEYHSAHQWPQNENRLSGPSPFQRVAKAPPSQPYCSIATESPLRVRPPGRDGPGGPERKHKHFFSMTLEIGGQCVCVNGDSVVVLDTGAAAGLVCIKWDSRK